MRVLITGGAGFIGSHLTEKLLQRGDSVFVVDNFDAYYPRAFKEENLEPVVDHPRFALAEGDIRDRPFVETTFRRVRPDVVVHLAACAGVRASFLDPIKYHEVNVAGTQNIIDACLEFRPSHLVAASSSSVYGSRTDTPFREDDPDAFPVSPYAATKRMNEHMAYVYHRARGLNATMVRIFTAYGPRQRPDMGIYSFTDRIDRGLPITVFGDGTTRRDYTYIDDVVDGFMRCIDRPLGFEILNLGSEFSITLIDLLRHISDGLGSEPILKRLPIQPGDVEMTAASVAKARRLLGYEPQVGIREGIVRFLEWYRSTRRNAGSVHAGSPVG